MIRSILRFSVLILIVLALLGMNARHASSDSISAADLIAAVNGIRTSYGLPALVESSILDGTAQWTAQYMADNQLSDHIGNVKGRVAAAGYGDGATIFATENWARFRSGSINDIMIAWSDAAHMIPMTNPAYQHIGAGVADSPIGTVYIVHAAYVAGGSSSSTVGTAGATAAPTISQVMKPVVTSTPMNDGAIVHIVEAGQTLWSIAVAYETHIKDIQDLNALGENSTIYVGMKLIIRFAPTPTISTTPTVTPVRPSRTPTPKEKPKTATPYYTLTITATPTLEPLIKGLPKLDRRGLGIIIIAVCGLGLGIVMIGTLRKK